MEGKKMTPLAITIIILAATIVAFISGRLPFSVISMGIILSLTLTGVMEPQEAFSGFTNKNVVMFTAMFIVGAGLVKTRILHMAQKIVMSFSHNKKMLVLLGSSVAGIIAILTSSTASAAIMLPLLIGIANEVDVSRSRLLFPAMTVANIATGMTVLGQGASNMAFNDIMMNAGGTTPFTIWSFTIARLPVLIIALAYSSLIGWRLLPDIPNDEFKDAHAVEDMDVLAPLKEVVAVFIIVLTVGLILFSKQIGIDMYIIAVTGAGALIVFGVLNEKEALSAIHLPTIFLFAGVLPLSSAIKGTGAGEVIADWMILMLGDSANPYMIIAVFFIVPLVMTQVMSNLATITIFIPLVSVAAVKIGVDPRALVMGVMIACTTSILTPMASPAQAIIMGPGGYKLKDYLKAGLPLTVIITVLSIFILPLLFPF